MVRKEKIDRLGAIAGGASSFKECKRLLHRALPEVGSGHLAEAVSSGFGFRTYAALRAFEECGTQKGVFSGEAMAERLESLGYRLETLMMVDEQAHAPAREIGVEPLLIEKDYERWCSSYGVQLLQAEGGGWYAWHLRGGATERYGTKARAAEAAWLAWNG